MILGVILRSLSHCGVVVPVEYAREFVCLISCTLPRCNHILTHRFVMYICVTSHNGLATTNFDVIIIRFRQLHSHSSTRVCNTPFPSSLVPLFQSESKCETFHMKMNSACNFIFMQVKVIQVFIRIVARLNPL